MASRKLSLQRGEKAAKVSSFAVALIGSVMGFVGLLSGSVVLLAEGIHFLTDIFASLAVYIGLRLARRKPTEKFPYGYYRAETFASLVVAALIILSGAEILRESVIRFLQPETVLFPYIAMSVAAISIPILYFLAKYNRKIGEEIGSQAIVGQAKHYILDAYSSVIVFVGILSSHLGIPWVEALIGVLIGVFILKTGVEIGRDSILTLMDAVTKPEDIARMKKVAEEVHGVIGAHDIRVRKSGPFRFGEMHIEVEEGLSIEKAHVIAEEVERRAKREFEELEILTTHMEPAKREKFRIAIPVEEDRGIESTVRPHFAKASHFILVDIDKEQIKNWVVKSNPGAKLSRKRGTAAANFLIANKVNMILTVELGEGPFHLLRDSFVEIYKLQKDSGIEESIRALLDNKLNKVESPTKES